MTPYRDINDEEWQRVTPLLPELRPRSELRGRPLANTRSVLNGVLWVMYSGATWSAMPRKYPSYQTCHRRFKARPALSQNWYRIRRLQWCCFTSELQECLKLAGKPADAVVCGADQS